MNAAAASSGRLAFADGLRGLAALWVVLFHCSEGGHLERLKAAMPSLASRFLFDWGHLGVPVFFVLSGYVMMHSVRGLAFTPRFAGRFMLRRLLRLTPPYYASILFVVVYSVVKSGLQGSALEFPSHKMFAAHLLYLQDILSLGNISSVYWTLSIEIQFYLAFSALMLSIHWLDPRGEASARKNIVLGLATLAALPWAFGLSTVPLYPGGFPSFWYCFMLGLYGSLQSQSSGMRKIFFSFITVLALFGFADGTGFTIAAVCAAGLLYLGENMKIVRNTLNNRVLQFLGLISYSLYLIHNQITGASAFIFKRLMPPTVFGELLYLVVTVMICILIAYFGYLLVEAPSIMASRKIRLTTKSISKDEMRFNR